MGEREMNELIMIASLLCAPCQVTSYRSVPEQTDSTPLITSTGSHVHKDGVAVSRDLLKRWGGPVGYGDMLYIDGYGIKIVNDCMGESRCVKWQNKKCLKRKLIRNHVDIWVETYEEEKKIGWRQSNTWLISVKSTKEFDTKRTP